MNDQLHAKCDLKLRIFHLMRTYGASGGENQIAQYFAAQKASDCVEETFAFVYHDPICRRLFARRGVPVKLVDIIGKTKPPSGRWDEFLSLLPYLPFAAVRLYNLLYNFRPNVCLVNGVQAAIIVWPIAFLFMWSGTKFCYIHRTTKVHGRRGFAKLLYYPYVYMIGNSESVASSLVELAPPHKILVMENGVDTAKFDKRFIGKPYMDTPENCPTMIAVGRLIAGKNQELLIEALAIIRKSYADATLWIVGTGPQISALERKAASHGVADAVFFLGHRDDVAELLGLAKVFVNASLREGMSNAVLEAMAIGLPSVVVDAPGVTECHEAGLTAAVVDNNPDAFASAVLEFLNEHDKAISCGKSARARIEKNYSITAARARYLTLYDTIIEPGD